MLDFLFNRNAEPDPPPPTFVRVRALERILACGAPRGGTETRTVGNPHKPAAGYIFHNCLDGETFELSVFSRQPDGNTYSSYVAARRTGMDAFEITAIVLDNHTEKLDNEKEVLAALDFIGEQVREIFRGDVPSIHHRYGQFSAFGRFLTRVLPRRDTPGGGLY